MNYKWFPDDRAMSAQRSQMIWGGKGRFQAPRFSGFPPPPLKMWKSGLIFYCLFSVKISKENVIFLDFGGGGRIPGLTVLGRTEPQMIPKWVSDDPQAIPKWSPNDSRWSNIEPQMISKWPSDVTRWSSDCPQLLYLYVHESSSERARGSLSEEDSLAII